MTNISRRTFLAASGAAALLPIIPAFPQSAPQEAPALAEAVAAGSLPPVAERLPTNPMVVEPFESVGQYGGDLRTALVGGGSLQNGPGQSSGPVLLRLNGGRRLFEE